MEKREKIIIMVAAATLIVGGVEFLYSPAENREGPNGPLNIEAENARLTSFVAKVQSEVAMNSVDDDLRHLLKKTEDDWIVDPFYEGANPFLKSFRDEKSAAALPVDIIYSGFIGVGDRRMAVLNGNEYEIGEQIEEGDYLIRQIFPDRLILEERVAEDAMARRFVIPLAEE